MDNASKWLAVSCPWCREPCVIPDDAEDADSFPCPRCHRSFRADAAMSLLDRAEAILRRITARMFVFAFRRVPAWLWDTLVGVLHRLADFILWLVPLSWK